MRVVVFGADGMLGRYVASYLKCDKTFDVIEVNRVDLDATVCTFQILCDFFDKLNTCDVVVNCVGVIPQSNMNAIDDSIYMQVNGLFPLMLASVCKSYVKCNMIHVTTDCVYDGRQGKYDEDSIANPTNMYGFSKAIGDNATCTIIRTSIIGEERKRKTSLLEWVLTSSDKNQVLKGYVNHMWNGVTCLQLAKVIHHIILNNLFWKGVRHIYSPNAVSKHELICYIRDVYDLSVSIEPSHAEYIIDRTLSSIYNECSIFMIPGILTQIQEQRTYSQQIDAP